MKSVRDSMKGQKGFTLVELLVVIAIVGVLAAVAVPRFSDQTVKANTAKAAADLRTIDSAISLAIASGIPAPTLDSDTTTGLIPNYIASIPAPPNGKAKGNKVSGVPGSAEDITIDSAKDVYSIDANNRAILLERHAEDYHN